jgi:hypothetical protein
MKINENGRNGKKGGKEDPDEIASPRSAFHRASGEKERRSKGEGSKQ